MYGTTRDTLIDIYDRWVKRNNLPEMSADELLCEIEESDNPNPHHIVWLQEFRTAWEKAPV